MRISSQPPPSFLERLRRRAARLPRPGPHARRGALVALAVTTLLAAALLGSQLHTGLGTTIDVLIGLALGVIGGLLVALASALVGWLACRLPRALTGAVVSALVALVAALELSERLALPLAAAVVLTEIMLGTALLTLWRGGLRRGSRVRRLAVAAALVGGLLGNGLLGWWIVTPGTAAHLPPPGPPTGAPPIEAPDPAAVGDHAVRTLTYGSGTDRRRPAYGAEAAITTAPVDASPFVSIGGRSIEGRLERRARTWYWGFGQRRFPLNGRVWLPEGRGPFPLVLVVHGNHDMIEPSDAGYAYLGRLLASRGFVLVAVDQSFLNGYVTGGLSGENDARAWLLLKHLELWRTWSETPGHRFYRRVDLSRVALVGHSRGGEAAAIAAAFNRLPRYPERAGVRFDFGFGVRAVAALAPTDGQYDPADQPTRLADVSYLVLQGGHDADVSAFAGVRQYERVTLGSTPRNGPRFKALLYVHEANHGQFNTVWGRRDLGLPRGWLLNTAPLLPGADQRRIAAVYLSALVETTLHEDTRYQPLFRHPAAGAAWLPAATYVHRYAGPDRQTVAGFEEDVDVTTATQQGAALLGERLRVWREQDLALRRGGDGGNQVVYLRWTARTPPARYRLTLPDPPLEDRTLGADDALVFELADARDPGPVVDASDTEGDAPGTDGDAETDRDSTTERERASLDLTIELVDARGVTASLPLSGSGRLTPPLVARFTKYTLWEARYGERQPVLQTFTLPLADVVAATPALDLSALREVRFVFDRSPRGAIYLDAIGFTPTDDRRRDRTVDR